MPCLFPVFKGMVKQITAVIVDDRCCVCLSPGVLPVAVYKLPHQLKCITARQTARLLARKSSVDSFVWQDFLSMALLTLSVMNYACCNRSAPTTGASTPRSCFALPDKPMMCANLPLEGRQLNTEILKVIAYFSESEYCPNKYMEIDLVL